MPLEKWKIAIRQLTEWIINQENFVILLKLDTDIAFKLLFLLFKGYPYQIIKMSLDFFDFKEICKTDCSENIFYINPSKIKSIFSDLPFYFKLIRYKYIIKFRKLIDRTKYQIKERQ